MLVGIDARALAARRGVARFTRRMAEALAALDGVDVRALVPGREPVEPVPGVELRRTALPSRALHLAGAVAGFPRIDTLLGGDVDVTWLPAPAPVAVGDPYVLTVHDLSWEDRPRDFTRYERLWHRAARPPSIARRARAVVCDAPSVADQVRERWGVTASVVEPGIDAPPREVAPRPGRPYFLYVGALEPRKGLDVLADAWARAGLDPDTELLIAGEGRAEVPPGATVLGHVGDAELHALYAGALAVVLPSRLEGFGLTPREAAAHGTPSIVSDLPTLRLPGTLRVPAGDADALARALRDLPARRAALVAELPPSRTWADAARELRAVLEGAAGP
ncbi:MAG TPA: glycosyltransferase family 1 protein [Baekduia sp.]|uniref:glycosyltransferase family 4 protein n=1 Tax=Baekduia sp. TaxID=2600305 RepID=UPI002D76899F|nr:glycosyltransferase family 1 protein [Baekduia sp.]HET6506161.1 glycosyltransferase family 1 protein [Baekduia sp.]